MKSVNFAVAVAFLYSILPCYSLAGASSFSISGTDAAKNEGNSGLTPFTFTVTRTGTESGASVNWSVTGFDNGGTGIADAADFGGQLPGGTLTFAPGEKSKIIKVTVTGDKDVELNDTFRVKLSNPVGATIETGLAVGKIYNDDVKPTPNVTPTPR